MPQTLRTCFSLLVFTVLLISRIEAQVTGVDLQVRATTNSVIAVIGQTNSLVIFRVTNIGSAASSGAVTVTIQSDTLPITSISGIGWNCSGLSCTRADSLGPGDSYPSVRVLHSHPPAVPGQSYLNVLYPEPVKATVTGGGDNNPINNRSSITLALPKNTHIFAWGEDASGQVSGPLGTPDAVSVSAAARRTIAVFADGSIRAWGANDTSQNEIPGDLGIVDSVAPSDNFTVAVRVDGTVTAWPKATTTPASGLVDIVKIVAGEFHSIALKGDGTVVAGPGTTLGPGNNAAGQSTVPPGLKDVVDIAAGWTSSYALKRDGTVIAWGKNPYGPLDPPPDLKDVVQIGAGSFHAVAIRLPPGEGKYEAVGWGANQYGQINFPQDCCRPTYDVKGGAFHTVFNLGTTSKVYGANRGESETELTFQSRIPDADPYERVWQVAAGFYHTVEIVEGNILRITVKANVPGVPVYFDGMLAPQGIVGGSMGTTHPLSAPASYTDTSGARWVFTTWNDGVKTPKREVYLSGPLVFTAQYAKQGYITTQATTGGAVSLPSGFYDAGSVQTLVATPEPGYLFTGFTGAVVTADNPANLTVTGDLTVQANFSPITASELHIAGSQFQTAITSQRSVAYFYVSNRYRATAGTVSVALTSVTGLTVASLNGAGWNCTNLTCSRSDSLAPGQSYPYIRVFGTVTGAPRSSTLLQAHASGGGDPSSSNANNTAALSAIVQSQSQIVGWGENISGQVTPPPGLTNVCDIAAAGRHSLALNCDGTIRAWGADDFGQSQEPAGLADVLSISPSDRFNAALLADGTAVTWGNGGNSGLLAIGTNISAVASGEFGILLLSKDGSVKYWGEDAYGTSNVPAGLKAVAIAAGWGQAYALRQDGLVVGWGSDPYNGVPPTRITSGGLNVGSSARLMSGPFHFAAFVPGSATYISEGFWGLDYYREHEIVDYVYTSIGEPVLPSKTDYPKLAVALGAFHTLVLRANDVIDPQGSNTGDLGQITNQSVIPTGLKNVTAVAAGFYHSLALTHP